VFHLDDDILASFENILELDNIRLANDALQDLGFATDHVDFFGVEHALVYYFESERLSSAFNLPSLCR